MHRCGHRWHVVVKRRGRGRAASAFLPYQDYLALCVPTDLWSSSNPSLWLSAPMEEGHEVSVVPDSGSGGTVPSGGVPRRREQSQMVTRRSGLPLVAPSCEPRPGQGGG